MAVIDLQLEVSEDTWTAHTHVAGYSGHVSASTSFRAILGALSMMITQAHRERQSRLGACSFAGVLPAVVVVPAEIGPIERYSDHSTIRNIERVRKAGIVWHVDGVGPVPYPTEEPVPVDPTAPRVSSTPSRKQRQRAARTADIDDVPWAVVDVEAFAGRRIVEIAIRRYVNRELVDVFETFVDPGEPLQGVGCIGHQVRDEHVAGAPTFDQIAPTVLALLAGCVAVGHSVNNDIKMLAGEAHRHHLTLPTMSTFDTFRLWETADYCERGRLADLAKHFGVEGGDYHFASTDARVSAEVAMRCIDDPLTHPQQVFVVPPSGVFDPHALTATR